MANGSDDLESRAKTDRWRAILLGAGSIFDIAGATAPPRMREYRKNREYGFQQDAERLAGDWQRVGGYFRSAIDKVNGKD